MPELPLALPLVVVLVPFDTAYSVTTREFSFSWRLGGLKGRENRTLPGRGIACFAIAG